MQVYFDNAATTPLVKEVISEMKETMDASFGNPSSIHSQGRSARAKIEKARRIIANGLNASLGEIFFTSSATESNNMAIRQAVEFNNVERIISSPTEHHCVLNTLIDLGKNKPVEIVWLSVDVFGNISLEELKSELTKSSKKTLVSLMYGNNEIGTMHPMKEISALCREYNALIHCDAVQVLGKYPIDLQELSVDYLSGTAHKFYGPKGSAFLYMNQEAVLPPFITGGAQERNMRAGTENIYGIVGLAKAFALSQNEMEARKEKIVEVRTYMKDQLLANFPDITFNGAQEGQFLYHILSVAFPHSAKNEMLIYNLDIKNISASAGSACSSGTNTGSHVLGAIKPTDTSNSIRFSFSHHNTIEEVDYVIACLNELIDS